MSFAFYQDFRETLCSKTTLEVQVSGSSIQCWRCVARVKFSVRRVFLSFKLTGVSNLMDCFCFYGYQSFSGIPQFHSNGSFGKNYKVSRLQSSHPILSSSLQSLQNQNKVLYRNVFSSKKYEISFITNNSPH